MGIAREVIDALLPRKPAIYRDSNRTKTDTGRRGENPKTLERIFVKELGKLAP